MNNLDKMILGAVVIVCILGFAMGIYVYETIDTRNECQLDCQINNYWYVRTIEHIIEADECWCMTEVAGQGINLWEKQ